MNSKIGKNYLPFSEGAGNFTQRSIPGTVVVGTDKTHH
jgi:hypothetical protein